MTAAAKPKPAARKMAARAKPEPVAPMPLPAPSAKTKAGKTAVTPASAKAMPASTLMPAPAAARPARIPPPSKGELRAQIEKLEAANAAFKAKSRETNRAAKAASRRIAELEAEMAQVQEQAARPVSAPRLEKAVRRGRPPCSREIDPGDAGVIIPPIPRCKPAGSAV